MKRLLCILLLITLFMPSLVSAQATNSYIWSYYAPTGISGVTALTTKLEAEVERTISAGHLLPYRALYGEGRDVGGQFYWYHAYDIVYALSLAYPFVSSSTQAKIKTYLQTEMSAYPLWQEGFISGTSGTSRQMDDLPAGLFSGEYSARASEYQKRPKLFAMYALWTYANATGNWSYIEANWLAIKSFFERNSGEISKYYTSIAGGIGFARMAMQKSTQDLQAANSAVALINGGFSQGRNFLAFGNNALNVYQYTSGESWGYTTTYSFLGFLTLDISPEITRYMYDDSSLRNAVLGSSENDDYSLRRAEHFVPNWYIAHPNAPTNYFGEGAGTGVDIRAMVFPLAAWVRKDSKARLLEYEDVPATVGDVYYLENLARIIQGQGNECWENTQTSGIECPQSILPTGSGATATPVPTYLLGDINKDGVVNGVDVLLVLRGIYQSQPDLDGNGVVNVLDFARVVIDWGK